MFYIGQKVVCISQDPEFRLLHVGEIYTIKNIRVSTGGLMFKEINSLGYKSGYFKFNRFRPLLDDSQEYADNLIKELETEINEENLILK